MNTVPYEVVGTAGLIVCRPLGSGMLSYVSASRLLLLYHIKESSKFQNLIEWGRGGRHAIVEAVPPRVHRLGQLVRGRRN